MIRERGRNEVQTSGFQLTRWREWMDMIILKCLWSRIELFSTWHQKPKKLYQNIVVSRSFCSPIYVVFVSYGWDSSGEEIGGGTEEVNSGSWAVEEMINFTTLIHSTNVYWNLTVILVTAPIVYSSRIRKNMVGIGTYYFRNRDVGLDAFSWKLHIK